MRIANAPAKKNIRRHGAYDRLEAQIDKLVHKEEKTDDDVKVTKRITKEMSILASRITTGDVARAIMRKKYRGVR